MVEPIARGAAELARRATTLIEDDHSGVGFGIWYKEDGSWEFGGALLELDKFARKRGWNLVNGRADPTGTWTETLSTAAFGSAAVIVAAQTSAHHGGYSDDLIPLQGELKRPRTTEQWLGASRPNPSFLYGDSTSLELSLRFPIGLKRFSRCDGITLVTMAARIARLAAERDWPIVYLHSPTAPPLREAGDGTGYDEVIDDPRNGVWPRVRTAGLRFAVATGASDVRARGAFVESVCEQCAGIGIEAWVGDNRPDRRGGQWVRLLAHDDGRYRGRPDRATARDDERLTHCLPITFVGPARIGSSAELLEPFVDAQVPIASASIVGLEGLAFVYLLVGQSPGHRLTAPNLPLGASAGATFQKTLQREVHLRKTSDYRGVVGQLKRIRHNASSSPFVAWASWRVPHRANALSILTSQLREALKAIMTTEGHPSVDVETVNIEYMVCRRVESGDLRGRCKLALPAEVDKVWRAPNSDGSRDALCQAIEQRWKYLVVRELEAEGVDLEFTWQEWRLGRWYTLLPGVAQ